MQNVITMVELNMLNKETINLRAIPFPDVQS